MPSRNRRHTRSKVVLTWQALGTALLTLAVVAGIVLGMRGYNANIEAARDSAASASPFPVQPQPSYTPEPTPTVPLTVPRGRPMRVGIANDSIGAGMYADTKANGFVLRALREIAKNAPEPVLLYGQQPPGAKLATIMGLQSFPESVDLAIVELGTNDIYKDTSLDDIATTYAAHLAKIRRTSPDAALLCIGPWPADGDRGIGREIEETCIAEDGVYVEIVDIARDSDNKGPEGRLTEWGISDDFHPNTRGHKLIAARVLEHLDLRA